MSALPESRPVILLACASRMASDLFLQRHGHDFEVLVATTRGHLPTKIDERCFVVVVHRSWLRGGDEACLRVHAKRLRGLRLYVACGSKQRPVLADPDSTRPYGRLPADPFLAHQVLLLESRQYHQRMAHAMASAGTGEATGALLQVVASELRGRLAAVAEQLSDGLAEREARPACEAALRTATLCMEWLEGISPPPGEVLNQREGIRASELLALVASASRLQQTGARTRIDVSADFDITPQPGLILAAAQSCVNVLAAHIPPGSTLPLQLSAGSFRDGDGGEGEHWICLRHCWYPSPDACRYADARRILQLLRGRLTVIRQADGSTDVQLSWSA